MTSTEKIPSHPLVVVKQSKIHGRGVFAKKDIKKGAKIIEYVGEKIPSDEGTRRSEAHDILTYIFTLDDHWDIDGAVNGNGAQYANHSCDSNCSIDIINKRIWLFADKDIKKGDEIVYDYDLDADELIKCLCGGKNCRGYMNSEEDKRVARILKKRTALAKKKKAGEKKKNTSQKKRSSGKKKSNKQKKQ